MDPAEAPSTTAAAAAAAATAAAAPVGEVTIEAQFALFRGLFDRGTITASEHQKLREKALGLIPDPTSHSSATHGIDNVLVAHFEEDRRRQEQPWRVEVTRHTDLKKSIACQSWEDLKTEFVDQAKNGLLSVEDVMTLTYLLFGNDDDRKFHAGCLLRLSSYESRVKAHNFHVASAREEAFMATWGSKLVKFQFPLFPKDGAFSSINLRLLREVDDGMPVGGGEAGRPSVFRRSTLSPDAAQAQAAAAAALGGEYWAPVQVGDDGIPWIDLSALEEAHTQLMDAIAERTMPPPGAGVGPRHVLCVGSGDLFPAGPASE